MGGPDEALGDDWISLVVDLETPVVHEPGPGALDDPTLGKDLEGIGVDLVDHLDADVVVPAVFDEGALEARVTPQLGEAGGAAAGAVGHGDPTGVVRGTCGHDHHCHEEPESVDDAEGLAPVNL